MRLYHAAVCTSNFGRKLGAYSRLTERGREMYEEGLKHVLESYHYVQKENYLKQVREDGHRIFLDSGAYSAMTQNAKIDMGAFVDYIHRNGDVIEQVSVLDEIGDPDGTWRNQMEMEARGTNPLPCYHYGEPTEVVDWYVKKYPYITIGGMVPIGTPQLRVWLDRIWEEHLTDAEGRPLCRVHGFGLTAPELMQRYPWFSVDSSSWQMYGSNGAILLPSGTALHVSAGASQRKVAGFHVSNLAPREQDEIRRIVEAEGLTLELLAEHHSHRWVWNVVMLPRVARVNGHCETFRAREQRLW